MLLSSSQDIPRTYNKSLSHILSSFRQQSTVPHSILALLDPQIVAQSNMHSSSSLNPHAIGRPIMTTRFTDDEENDNEQVDMYVSSPKFHISTNHVPTYRYHATINDNVHPTMEVSPSGI